MLPDLCGNVDLGCVRSFQELDRSLLLLIDVEKVVMTIQAAIVADAFRISCTVSKLSCTNSQDFPVVSCVGRSRAATYN